jgi:hypothetical protein
MPSTATSKPRNYGFDFKRFYENDQPSTSNAFTFTNRRNYTQLTNGGKSNGDDDDIQFVAISSRTPIQRPQSREIPSLIPISKAFQPTVMTNGFSRENSVKPQPSRGRRSVLDFLGKNRVSIK